MYVAYDPNENAIVVAFRGSKGDKAGMNNLNFHVKDWNNCGNGCRVHSGFADSYDLLKH